MASFLKIGKRYINAALITDVEHIPAPGEECIVTLATTEPTDAKEPSWLTRARRIRLSGRDAELFIAWMDSIAIDLERASKASL